MNNYGICLMSVVACRQQPSSTSEMVTQLLFGETYIITEEQEDWIFIHTTFDNYPCWISRKQHQYLSDKEFNQFTNSTLNTELVQVITCAGNNSVFPITIGASLPQYHHGKLSIAHQDYLFDGATTQWNAPKTVEEIKQTAYVFLNAPYLWGGRSPFGIDCSGFTQLVFKLNGYKIPRDASQQVELGSALSFVEEAQVGDLAFFDNEQGAITHVGLVLENQHIIHASGSVRVDKFDHYGIFHSDNKKYSHSLRVIKTGIVNQ